MTRHGAAYSGKVLTDVMIEGVTLASRSKSMKPSTVTGMVSGIFGVVVSAYTPVSVLMVPPIT